METTLKDLLHAINIIGEDTDVYVDGIDSIAVCPPVRLTPEGNGHFKEALSARVNVEYRRSGHHQTYVGSDDEETDEKAWDLLSSLAGYCRVAETERWFEGAGAEII